MSKKINACIIGASGYTGIELIRLLYSHPMVNIKYLVADSNAGTRLAEIYNHMGIYQFPDLVKELEKQVQAIEGNLRELRQG